MVGTERRLQSQPISRGLSLSTRTRPRPSTRCRIAIHVLSYDYDRAIVDYNRRAHRHLGCRHARLSVRAQHSASWSTRAHPLPRERHPQLHVPVLPCRFRLVPPGPVGPTLYALGVCGDRLFAPRWIAVATASGGNSPDRRNSCRSRPVPSHFGYGVRLSIGH